jgi:hypothetical protein
MQDYRENLPGRDGLISEGNLIKTSTNFKKDK